VVDFCFIELVPGNKGNLQGLMENQEQHLIGNEETILSKPSS